MSITRANAEFMIQARVGPLMTAAGLDGTTVDGTNADLNGPIGRAVRDLDHTVTDITSVTDTDVAQVTEYDEFLDIAVLKTLGVILGNLDDVDVTAGPRSEKLSQLAEQVERKADRLLESMERDYGYGLAIPETGYITNYIAEHDDD